LKPDLGRDVSKARTLVTWSNIGAYLDLFLAKRDFANNFQSGRLVWLWIPEIFRLEDVFVFLAARCRGQR
jgi:hypothetical protein